MRKTPNIEKHFIKILTTFIKKLSCTKVDFLNIHSVAAYIEPPYQIEWRHCSKDQQMCGRKEISDKILLLVIYIFLICYSIVSSTVSGGYLGHWTSILYLYSGFYDE